MIGLLSQIHVSWLDKVRMMTIVGDNLFEPLREECEHFVECVKTRNRPLSDGEHGLRVLKLLECAQLSLSNGGREMEVTQ